MKKPIYAGLLVGRLIFSPQQYVYRCNETILTYRGVPLGWGAGWAVTRKMGVGQLSKAEEPESKMTKLIDGIRDGIV